MRAFPIAVLVLAIVGTGCQRSASDTRRLPITGVVARVDRAGGRIDLAHDALDGVMPAMTMTVAVSGSLRQISPGDRVSGTLAIDRTSSTIEDIHVIARAAGSVLSWPTTIEPAPVGADIPPVQLVDQDGTWINTRQFAGQPLVVTFIYTRCPMPEYCPRTMRQLEELRRTLQSAPAAKRIHLLAVTLDPMHDNPPALREYARAFITAPDAASSWTLATGRPGDIARLAAFFGVSSSTAGDVIIHTRSAALVGADGRLQRVFSGDEWGAADILSAVQASRAGS